MKHSVVAMRLGEKWIEELASRVPAFDLAEKQAALERAAASLEHQAKSYIDHLRTSLLLEGMAACIERGSNTLILLIPAEFLGAAAFVDFRHWADGEGLLMVCHEPRQDGGGDDPQRIVVPIAFVPTSICSD